MADETTVEETPTPEEQAEAVEKEAEVQRHGGVSEYTLAGPVKARQVTVETKAQGFPDHHLTAKPGWYIVEFPADVSGYNPIYAGYPLEIVLPPEAFHENFEEAGGSKASTPTVKASTSGSASKSSAKDR